jgi:hypothetical protein
MATDDCKERDHPDKENPIPSYIVADIGAEERRKESPGKDPGNPNGIVGGSISFNE